jgi:hypothetical protein
MKIATFNINDVNKRLGNLIGWLRAEKPEVVALQELKAADREFPEAAIEKFQRIIDAPLRMQANLRRLIPKFPGIRTASPQARKQIGLKVLNEAGADGSWGLEYKRIVELPDNNS